MDFGKEVGKLDRWVFPCYRLQSSLVRNKVNLGFRFLLKLVTVFANFPCYAALSGNIIVNDRFERMLKGTFVTYFEVKAQDFDSEREQTYVQ